MKGLAKKRVLITGGANGIGAATASRFLDEGARVKVLDRDAEGCARLEQQFSSLATSIVADVTDVDAVATAFENIDAVWNGLDILINNAGISLPHAFMEVRPEDWSRILDVNLNGVFHVAQEAARRMSTAGAGVIINMGSTNALIGMPRYAAYNVSKAGVVALTRTMALELAPNIRVNAVCPGYVLTPMQQAEYTAEEMAGLNEKVPLGRHAAPEEVAALFAFLASDEAPFISGQAIVIDGAELAGGLASR
ncbi:MAG: oxidoreductase [Acidobacteria bacterium]|jgi:NAD(P)-dependent dehydrogenase (short-subunit alcohol dehydrogenase family)|nr:oxidoreductase [Acidobacteriota bacterium]MBF83113.1 oxidoreductase [Acidobacteriota bacterium]MEC7769181.1 SDR family NAD(P)-dependent oxidoreductase [Acidobacteriota bacterium]|tara:strand:- start:1460 stop:2212 length:753 start_codon:yes stop_codon:yes gene_type:complete